jgi:siroheme synthase-like protein
MKYLPVGLDLRGRACVVVGGGTIGARKVRTLIGVQAKVRLVSPEAHEDLRELAKKGLLDWVRREYQEGDLEGAFLAVAATDDPEVNKGVVRDAQAAGSLVCDASSSHRSQVIFGALLEEGDVTLAVFTDGQDPSLARKTRDRMAGLTSEWKED